MPTGYTACIVSDKGATFQEYALGCARAFGACIEMRDDPIDKPIPDEFKTDNYHSNAIKKAIKAIKEFESMNDKEVAIQSKKDFESSLKNIDQAIKENRIIAKKYQDMKEKVEKWEPPTHEHIEFKNFMLQQISVSTEHDMTDYYLNQRKILKIKTIEEWRSERKKSLVWDLNYHNEEHANAVSRANSRTKWIQELKNSLIKEA